MILKDKRVLVTGAGGFIGSHLTETLLEQGCKVRAFTNYNGQNSWGWLDEWSDKKNTSLEVVLGDIRNLDSIKDAMQDIDVVFHLAALIGIPFSYQSPDAYVETNITGTLNILQCCRDRSSQVQRILITSSSEVYGTAQYVPIDEKHPLQAQ